MSLAGGRIGGLHGSLARDFGVFARMHWWRIGCTLAFGKGRVHNILVVLTFVPRDVDVDIFAVFLSRNSSMLGTIWLCKWYLVNPGLKNVVKSRMGKFFDSLSSSFPFSSFQSRAARFLWSC